MYSDETILAYLHYIAEGRKAMAERDMIDARLRIAHCLTLDRRPWSVSSIADATGLNRVTVRERLKASVERGTVAFDPDTSTYTATEAGMKFLREMFTGFLDEVQPALLRFHRLLDDDLRGGGG